MFPNGSIEGHRPAGMSEGSGAKQLERPGLRVMKVRQIPRVAQRPA